MIQTKEATTFEKYPEYKDSGSYWSGQIPEEWNALPIRAIFEERNEKNDGPKTDFILSVTKDRGVIPYDEKGAVGNNKSEEIERYKLVYPNDFVINKMNVVIGSLGMSKYFGAFSQVYLVYKPKTSQINIEYYSYIFSNPTFYKSLIKFCTGIMELRESLNKSDFKKIILPFPSFETQTSIVNFLDDKTSKIDTAIAQKEQMIELLKERKQIVIQNAVTKGLDPNVKMKDSGVEWIGEIPEGWQVKRCKYLFYEATERSIDGSEELLSVSHMTGVTPRSEKEVHMFLAEDYSGSKLCKKGDVIYNIMWAWMGALGVAHQTGIVSPSYGVYRQLNANVLNNEFLEYKLKTTEYVEHYNKVSTGLHSSRLRFYAHMFMNMEIAFPQRNEQDAIVEFIETQSSKIEKAISLQQTQIEKLKEYKSTLIDSAVTGKIKING